MIEKLNEKIIKLLLEHKKYVKANDLAIDLGVNEKTIRRRIQQINAGFFNNVGSIVSKKGQGYKLIVDNEDEFKKYYDNNMVEVDMNNPLNRRVIIFERLIDNKYNHKSDLLDKLYISESTLNKDISDLNNYMSKVNVKIKFSNKFGYYIEGKEYYIRNILLQLIHDSGFVGARKKRREERSLNISKIIAAILYEEEIYINKHILDAIANYITIAIRNISKGRLIELDDEVNKVQLNSNYMMLTKKIYSVISVKANIDFNYNETVFLAYFLKNILPYDAVDFAEYEIESLERSKNYANLVKEIINKIGIRNMTFECEEEIIKFFYGFIMRVKLDIQKKELIYLKIETTHSQSFVISKIIFKEIERLMNIKISREEIAYFSIIIHNYYFSIDKESKKVLTILPSDKSIAQMYKDELRNFSIFNIEFISYKEFLNKGDSIAQDYSLILNPFEEVFKISNIKEYRIFDIISRSDFMNISRLLSYKNYNLLVNNLDKIKALEEDSISKNLFSKSYYSRFLGSYIGFINDKSILTMSYNLYKTKLNKVLVFLINKNLSSDEISDLLKVATDAIIKFQSTGIYQTRNELIKTYKN
ncbi:MAG: HTH domain-containing protein [Clostridium sp.]|nr:HTH domain-containing protein [Clostridium sp.]